VNDDDNELARLLNDQVDQRLGPKRPAPPFDAARAATVPGRRGRRSWLLPLIAAACVAAVGGTVGATRLLADNGAAPATTPPLPSPSGVVTPTISAPNGPTSAAPTPSATPPAAPTTQPGPTEGSRRPVVPLRPSDSKIEPRAATTTVVVRPVRADGTPAAGYTVRNETFDQPLSCDVQSSVAVDEDIDACGYTSTNTLACWRSAEPGYVLCLRNPLTKTLVRAPLEGTFATRDAVAEVPLPQTMALGNGAHCTIYGGGAHAAQPTRPDWGAYYGCDKPGVGDDIYGPRGGNVIDRSRPQWTVEAFGSRGAGVEVTRKVVTAYFVGTAP
jgi:hypothetical protein